MPYARLLTARSRRAALSLYAATLAVLLLASAAVTTAAPAQDAPSVSMPSAEAAREMLRQLDAIDGPVTFADLQPVDGLGPPPWISFLPGRDPATVVAWAEVARRTSQFQVNGRQVPGVMPIYEELEPATMMGDNEDQASGELIAGLGSGGDDSFDTRLFGSLVAPPIRPNCPSVENDGSIALANPTVIGALTPVDLCGGVIGDGPYGVTTGDSDFFALNVVAEGATMQIDVGTFDPTAEVPEVVTAIYNSAGELIATGEDGGADFASTSLLAVAPATDRYYASVTGCCANQTDPNDPSSVPGVTTTGEYLAFIGSFFAIEPPEPVFCESAEPDDSLGDANVVDFGPAPFATCFAAIGDGEYGDSTGDYDFYVLPELPAGSPLVIDIDNIAPGDASVVVTLYSSDGVALGSWLDENDDTLIEYPLPATDSYFVAVGGCCEPTGDPAVPGSGPGAGDGELETGPYVLNMFSPALLPPPPDQVPPPIPAAGELRRLALLFGKLRAPDQMADAANRWADPSPYATAFQAQDAQLQCRSVEDDGTRATSNVVSFGSSGTATCAGLIGDAQPETGDFDLYSLGEMTAGDNGGVLVVGIQEDPQPIGPIIEPIPVEEVPIEEPGARQAPEFFEPTVEIIDPNGEVIATGQAFQPGVSEAFFLAELDGEYWFRLGGSGSAQADPDDASSGSGPGSTGEYAALVSRSGLVTDEVADVDTYLVDLEVGDILRVGLVGPEATILRPDGSNAQASSSSASFIYPRTSPLRHLGNTGVEHVAEVTGRHAISIGQGGGPYEAELRVVRPGLTYTEGTDTQILWLDFDGAEVDPSIYGPFTPPQTVTLSPLADFLTDWGLDADDEDAVIDAIIAVVEEDYNGDLPITGGNGDRDASGNAGEFDVEIRNSRDHGDLWGEPNVTRLIIGGTIEESGIPTVGIAQSIDPGNFETEETALVLLDLLSSPADPAAPGLPTLNQYAVAVGASKIDLVGQGVGAITSHEAGHMLGGWHTETTNETLNIMDAGGNLDAVAGVGPDRIWGTADDLDLDHVTDVYDEFEGFSGTEDLAVRMGRALSTGRTAPDNGGFQPEPGIYRLQNLVYDSYLHADGTENVDTSAFPDDFTQWQLIADGDSWLLRNTENGYYLDADFAAEDFNVELSQFPGEDDRWTFTDDGTLLRNNATGRYLSANGGDGVNVDQSLSADNANATRWLFEPVDDDPAANFIGRTVTLRNRQNVRWLDADGADEGFNADTSSQLSAQTQWAVIDAGNGYIYLRNVGTSRFLDTDANGDVDTSASASSDDRWELIDLGAGYYNLRSVDRGRYLDADGAEADYDVNQSTDPSFDDQWEITVIEGAD